MSMSREVSFKLHLSLVRKSPLALNTLSDSTDVGGTTNNADLILLMLSVSSLLDVNMLISLASVSALGLLDCPLFFNNACNSLASGIGSAVSGSCSVLGFAGLLDSLAGPDSSTLSPCNVTYLEI